MATTPTDVVNRGLQRVGSKLIAAGALLTETSKQAEQARACYDIIRTAEMSSNVWRFSIRNCILRALESTSRRVTFPAWATGTVYQVGAIATDGGLTWQSTQADKVATITMTSATPAVFSLTSHGFIAGTPFQLSTTGALYTGLAVDTTYYVIAAGLTANAFEASATLAGSAINTSGSQSGVHTITAGMNTAHTPADASPQYWTRYAGPQTATPHDTTLSYMAGELVYDTSNNVYLSLTNDNEDVPPTANWRLLTGATLSIISNIYPLGLGPATQSSARSVYMLPYGYLREANQSPNAGRVTWLGAPTGPFQGDWSYENQCFVSILAGPIIFRFAADIADASQFHPMFVEGLGCRVGIELAEILTQSSAKVEAVEKQYAVFMGKARIVNAIEVGPVNPAVDEFLVVRY